MLQAASIDAFYGTSHVLKDVSVDVTPGESVAILGRNGAGKTTLFKSIMQTGPRVDGSIRYGETELVGLDPEDVSQLGVAWVPENQRMFPNLTVGENLVMGGGESDMSADVYRRVFDLFPRLEERLDQKARTLSGGERQMVALARALVSDPEVLLVDEPFEGLMPKLVDQVESTLEQLIDESDDDLTMLIAEQSSETVLDQADSVYVIENGRIVFDGDAAEFAGDTELQKQYLGV